MDVPTLKLVLKPKLTVFSVWNTGETGDINISKKVVSGEKKVTDYCLNMNYFEHFKGMVL